MCTFVEAKTFLQQLDSNIVNGMEDNKLSVAIRNGLLIEFGIDPQSINW